MTLTNLLLILLSAGIHVVAHVALKRSRDRAALVWWFMLWGSVLFAPLLLTPWPVIPLQIGVVMLLSAGFEAGYFVSIAKAYQTGDLSIVYPLARGTAPVLLLVWTVVFIGEKPTAAGAVGVAIIAAGLYLINLPNASAWLEPLRALGQPGPRWALAGGLCISLYTVLDRYALRAIGTGSRTWPLLYTYLITVLTLLLLTPWTLRTVGAAGLRREWQAASWTSALAGLTNISAYAIVLYAIQAGTPASYAGAVREFSVVFGAAAGVLLLKERGSAMRVAGAVCVAAGVAVIAVLG